MHELILEPGRAERNYWRDLWRYRELFYFLVWRNILVRYKQTVVGVGWAFIRPFLTMVVLTVVFGKLAKMPSGGVPYPILVFCGMLPWQFFANALSESGNSLVGNAGLISKVYFPRLIVPASSVITSLGDFMISGVILVRLRVWYQYLLGIQVLLLADRAPDFAGACVKLIRNPSEAAAMADRAWSRFLKEWTWDAIAPRVWEAAEDCLRQSAGEGQPRAARLAGRPLETGIGC